MILIKGKLYDTLKFVAQVLLPALGTLYFALAGIWHLPAAEQVIGTIVVVDTFLGTILHLSSTAYNNQQVATGSLVVIPHADGHGLTHSLELDEGTDLDRLPEKDKVVFKIKAAAKDSTPSPPR